MSASKHAASVTRSTRSGVEERQGGGTGAASLSPPAYGIALADQGPSPTVQSKQDGPAALQMKRPGRVPSQAWADDQIITTFDDAQEVEVAMERYWGVDVNLPPNPTAVEVEILQRIHAAMKPLPKDDTIDSSVWLTLSIDRGARTATWNPNGTITFPSFAALSDADKRWVDSSTIHEAGHAVEEAYGAARVQDEFTEGVAGWVLEDPVTFQRNHPGAHAALIHMRRPLDEDPLNRMFEDRAAGTISTICRTNVFATFPTATRASAMRVSNYSLSSPREFFAEMYTAFYQGANPNDIADPNFGNVGRRLDPAWATWIRDNIHNRNAAGQAAVPEAATAGAMPDVLRRFLDAAIALNPNFMVQRKGGAPGAGAVDVQRVAAAGTRGPAGALPHLGAIQRSFGPDHDLSAVQAYVGGPDAEAATRSFGATAFAMGDSVVFEGAPDLETAAHEAAHVVQQRAGVQLKDGVGAPGDPYERNADAVAGRVVQGQSAADLLDGPVR